MREAPISANVIASQKRQENRPILEEAMVDGHRSRSTRNGLILLV